MSIGPHDRNGARERQGDVLAHRALHQQRLGAVAGHVDEAGADGVGRMAERRPACRRPSSSPPAGRSEPARTSNSSSWPWPSSATTPRTSPGTEVERDVARAWCRARRFARADARRAAVGGRRRRAGVGAPRAVTVLRDVARASARRSGPRSPRSTSTTPTVSPSRRTVARSQTAAISMRRCEMKMTERPMPRWRPTTSSTRSVRSAGSAAVISSSSRTSGSIASARARSMTRSVASGRSRAMVGEVEVGDAELAPASARKGSTGVRVSRRFERDVEVGDERRFLVDRDEPAAAGLGRGAGDVRLAADEDRAARPGGRRR